jgi:hypothetical protein
MILQVYYISCSPIMVYFLFLLILWFTGAVLSDSDLCVFFLSFSLLFYALHSENPKSKTQDT